MFNLTNRSLWATPTTIALAILSNGLTLRFVNANELKQTELSIQQINNYSQTKSMEQVNSVNQLSDVSPTDWAYEALRSLVERYGCIVGYPDRTYRGNRSLSRYEFAAGLNACMQQMERLIASSEAVLKEDLEILKRLMKEFENELAMLGARVDNLESRVAFLEDHQFSTTTKLNGEVIIAFVAPGDSEVKEDQRYQGLSSENEAEESDTQATLSDRVRLTLDSSFTGKDRLRIRLAAGNIPNLGRALGTDMARLNFEQTTDNNVIIDRAYYQAPLGDFGTFWIGTAVPPQEIYNTVNPFLGKDAEGALARVNRYNPFIYRQPGTSGIGFKFDLADWVDLTASYLAANANDPSRGNGLFNGTYSTGVQLGFKPVNGFDLAVAYMHSYFAEGEGNLTGSTGSNFTSTVSRQISEEFLNPDGSRQGGFRGARDPFSGAATSSENVGLQASWMIGSSFNLAGWVGWSFATAHSHDSTGINRRGDNADLFTWNLNFSVLDLLKEGAILSVAGGQVPRVTNIDGTFGRDREQAWIVEGQYKFPLNDNISITPGVYAIFNDNSNIEGEDAIVGVIRTVFKF
jgi:hypothetical protein